MSSDKFYSDRLVEGKESTGYPLLNFSLRSVMRTLRGNERPAGSRNRRGRFYADGAATISCRDGDKQSLNRQMFASNETKCFKEQVNVTESIRSTW